MTSGRPNRAAGVDLVSEMPVAALAAMRNLLRLGVDSLGTLWPVAETHISFATGAMGRDRTALVPSAADVATISAVVRLAQRHLKPRTPLGRRRPAGDAGCRDGQPDRQLAAGDAAGGADHRLRHGAAAVPRLGGGRSDVPVGDRQVICSAVQPSDLLLPWPDGTLIICLRNQGNSATGLCSVCDAGLARY